MIDPIAEQCSHARLAHLTAQRAADRAQPVISALDALQLAMSRLARAAGSGEPLMLESAWLTLGAVEALVAGLTAELDGVLDHLGQLDPTRQTSPRTELMEAVRALRRIG